MKKEKKSLFLLLPALALCCGLILIAAQPVKAADWLLGSATSGLPTIEEIYGQKSGVKLPSSPTGGNFVFPNTGNVIPGSGIISVPGPGKLPTPGIGSLPTPGTGSITFPTGPVNIPSYSGGYNIGSKGLPVIGSDSFNKFVANRNFKDPLAGMSLAPTNSTGGSTVVSNSWSLLNYNYSYKGFTYNPGGSTTTGINIGGTPNPSTNTSTSSGENCFAFG